MLVGWLSWVTLFQWDWRPQVAECWILSLVQGRVAMCLSWDSYQTLANELGLRGADTCKTVESWEGLQRWLVLYHYSLLCNNQSIEESEYIINQEQLIKRVALPSVLSFLCSSISQPKHSSLFPFSLWKCIKMAKSFQKGKMASCH